MRACFLALLCAVSLIACNQRLYEPQETPAPDDDDASFPPQDDDDTEGDDDSTAPPDADGDGTPDEDDCAPADASIHPGAQEVCDDVDQDCDGEADDGLTSVFYFDADGDGWGDPATEQEICSPQGPWTQQGQDCNDQDPLIHPGSAQQVDGVDSDCDGRLDWLVTLHLAVDDDFEWCIDDEATLQPGATSWTTGATWQVFLPSGPHGVGIRGWDTGQVITAGIAHITLSNGTTWVTDASWKFDPQPAAGDQTRVGWCGAGFDDSAWQLVNVIGPIGTSPWGGAPSTFPSGSPAMWVWDYYPVNLNTQYLRKVITLP